MSDTIQGSLLLDVLRLPEVFADLDLVPGPALHQLHLQPQVSLRTSQGVPYKSKNQQSINM